MRNYCNKKPLITILSIFLVLATLVSCGNKGELYTEDISDYNSDQHHRRSSFFLPELPTNADVVFFSSYNYYNEIFDQYLELKFNTKEEMHEYISSILDYDLASFSKENREEPAIGWVVEETNPYNSSYTDLISTSMTSGTFGDVDIRWVGYKISITGKEHIEANLSIVSYSDEELTVIQSYLYGYDYTFSYFTRFNIPLDKNHERIVKVE